MTQSQPRGRLLKVAMIAVVVLGVVGALAAAGAGGLGGGRSASYTGIATPPAVSAANRGVAVLIAKSQNAALVQGREQSKTMTEDASGKQFGGGESNRETQYNGTLLMGRLPGFAVLDAFGWGSPSGAYRLDATIVSPLVSVSSPFSGVAMDPVTVNQERGRLAGVYSDIFSAIGVSGQWDPRSLARNAVVKRYNDGPEITMVGALLPPRSSEDQTGSLVVFISGGWALESVYVETSDETFYRDVVNGTF